MKVSRLTLPRSPLGLLLFLILGHARVCDATDVVGENALTEPLEIAVLAWDRSNHIIVSDIAEAFTKAGKADRARDVLKMAGALGEEDLAQKNAFVLRMGAVYVSGEYARLGELNLAFDIANRLPVGDDSERRFRDWSFSQIAGCLADYALRSAVTNDLETLLTRSIDLAASIKSHYNKGVGMTGVAAAMATAGRTGKAREELELALKEAVATSDNAEGGKEGLYRLSLLCDIALTYAQLKDSNGVARTGNLMEAEKKFASRMYVSKLMEAYEELGDVQQMERIYRFQSSHGLTIRSLSRQNSKLGRIREATSLVQTQLVEVSSNPALKKSCALLSILALDCAEAGYFKGLEEALAMLEQCDVVVSWDMPKVAEHCMKKGRSDLGWRALRENMRIIAALRTADRPARIMLFARDVRRIVPEDTEERRAVLRELLNILNSSAKGGAGK